MTTQNDNKLNQTVVQKPRQPKQVGDYIVGKVLGEGTFGRVRLATHKHTNQKVAIKFLQKKKIVEVADFQRVSREMHILKLVRHPNLVQLYQIIQTPKQLLLIMEYMQNGELFDYIVKNKRIKEDQAIKMFHQLIDSLEYIHKIRIAHRDLKPQNILLSYNKSLKIVDFGLGNTYKQGEKLKTPCGSPCYAAPQMIQGQKYDPLKVDIWSAGIILFAMMNGYLPFQDENNNQLYRKVLTGTYSFHDKVSQQAKDLIKKILNNDPKQRYTIEQIRKHSWMQKLRGKTTNQGIIVGYNKIPVDQQILKELTKYGNQDLNYVQTCIQANRHNQVTATYYLEMKKFIRAGGVSKYDMTNQNFDRKSIQPNRRKQNSQILIDNFFAKNAYGGSTQLQRHNRKSTKNKLSRQKDQNKENISILMNKKKSKQKVQKKSKDRSKDNIKIVFKEQNVNTSCFLNTVSSKNPKLRQSVQKRPQNLTKKNKLEFSTTKMQRKNKLDCSLNYGKVPMIRSVQKNSGRESQAHTQVRIHRQSIMQSKIGRKTKEQLNQSLISKSKGKLKTSTTRDRPRINSSINQSLNKGHSKNPAQINNEGNGVTLYQGFNTTTIAHAGHMLTNMNKKLKDHDTSMQFINEYLARGKKTQQKKSVHGYLKSDHNSSKMLKPRFL